MAWTDPIDTAVTGAIAPAAMWNEVRDNFALVGPHEIAKKSADEPVASSTTPQDDADLILPVLANEKWSLIYELLVRGESAADLTVRWTFPTGGSLTCFAPRFGTGGTLTVGNFVEQSSPTAELDFFVGSTTETSHHVFRVLYENGANAGNVVLQWAQFASNATATVLKAGSRLWGAKL